MTNVLYVDACFNRRSSRTERLAQALLERLRQKGDVTIQTLVLNEEKDLAPLNEARLNHRIACMEAGDFSDPIFSYARQFAAADEIVVAAPYWDFSFPAKFKAYLELLCAQGVTFTYSDEGIPQSLVHARRAYYVTTSGGYTGEHDYGWLQVCDMFKLFFGIPEITRYSAEGLDIVSNDPEAIVLDAIRQIQSAC